MERQHDEGWGAKVIDRLSHDLKTAFPDMSGFSPRNLKYMRKFAESWSYRTQVRPYEGQTMAGITENALEQTAIGWFESLGWQTAFGPDISPDGAAPEREDYDQVVLLGRLQTALENINSNIPTDAISEAVRKITRAVSLSLIENNRRFHLLSPRQAGKSDTNRFGAGGGAL